MNKRSLLLFVTVILLGCNFLFPAREPSSPSNEPENFSFEGFTVVRLHPRDGDIKKLLEVEAQKALELGQMPVVEFDATWCPPCQAIDEGLKSKNELLLKAYAGTYIIKLDVDEWGWRDSTLHDFDFDGIPVYFKLDAQGQPTGETIDGNAWGDNIPENIAPPMEKFFHGK